MPDEVETVRVRVDGGPEFDMRADDLADALALGERLRAYLREQVAAYGAYGQSDDDPRVVAARAQLAELGGVDQVDAPAPAPSRRARRGTTQAP